MKNRIVKALIMATGILLGVTAYGTEVKAFDNATDEQKEVIEERVREALEKGEKRVDIKDLDIRVNMYSDKFSPEYMDLMDYCDGLTEKLDTYFTMGDYKTPYMFIGLDVVETENSDEWGCGENLVESIALNYDTYYVDESETVDLTKIGEDKKIINEETEYLMSLINDDMTDVEKALLIYDYIQATTNYSTDKTVLEDGTDTYKNSDYDPISLFRNHVSVCNANAAAYSILLNTAGIRAVKVDSKKMNHSWTMLELDGKWYHADVTWDDSFLSRYLANSYCNNDMWDNNNAGHAYFLKSDDEMKNYLNHYDWALDPTEGYSAKDVKKTPKAKESYAFTEYRFSNNREAGNDGRMNYIDGYWYYIDKNEGKIAKSKAICEENGVEYIDTVECITSLYSYGSCLYLLNGDGLYEYDTKNNVLRQVMGGKSYGDNAVITELCIYNGILSYVIAIPKDNNPDTLWMTSEDEIDNKIEFVTGQYTMEEIRNMNYKAPGEETTEVSTEETTEITEETTEKTEESTEVSTEKNSVDVTEDSKKDSTKDKERVSKKSSIIRIMLIIGGSMLIIGIAMFAISIVVKPKN